MERRTRTRLIAFVTILLAGCGNKNVAPFSGFPAKTAQLRIENSTETFRSTHSRVCTFTKRQRRTQNFVSIEAEFKNDTEGTSLLFRTSQGQCDGSIRVRNPMQFRFSTEYGSFLSEDIREGDCTLSVTCDSSEIDREAVLIKRVEVRFICESLPLSDGERKKTILEFTCA